MPPKVRAWARSQLSAAPQALPQLPTREPGRCRCRRRGQRSDADLLAAGPGLDHGPRSRRGGDGRRRRGGAPPAGKPRIASVQQPARGRGAGLGVRGLGEGGAGLQRRPRPAAHPEFPSRRPGRWGEGRRRRGGDWRGDRPGDAIFRRCTCSQRVVHQVRIEAGKGACDRRSRTCRSDCTRPKHAGRTQGHHQRRGQSGLPNLPPGDVGRSAGLRIWAFQSGVPRLVFVVGHNPNPLPIIHPAVACTYRLRYSLIAAAGSLTPASQRRLDRGVAIYAIIKPYVASNRN